MDFRSRWRRFESCLGATRFRWEGGGTPTPEPPRTRFGRTAPGSPPEGRGTTETGEGPDLGRGLEERRAVAETGCAGERTISVGRHGVTYTRR
jgi:hypothetical protein